ncbi:MAG TPA: MBL fold metallo-hydrolase [Pirellulales bacterium]|jgi:phosphoribosyl 1,2-cyclic phosphodiesterase|nr:MBL fold metallo-hydrolase [Pirellulales bacterium]
MDDSRQFRIRYWGVTGTLARSLSPGEVTDKLALAIQHLLDDESLAEIVHGQPDLATIRRHLESRVPLHLRSTYGGNSTCVEVETPGELIILDCGSGFRDLGRELNRRWSAPDFRGRRAAHILLTHSHIDHIVAIPFVDPLYDSTNHFTLWAPQGVLDNLEAVFGERAQLSRTYVPTNYAEMSGIKEFRAIAIGAEFYIGQTTMKTYALNHPGGCVAYRLERGGRKFVFATDHEHLETPDQGLAEFARDADLLYADAQYLAAEYDGKIGIGDAAPRVLHGWGHSTVEAAVATAVAACVRMLHLGHHEPARGDAELNRIEHLAERLLADSLRDASCASDACQLQLAREDFAVDI